MAGYIRHRGRFNHTRHGSRCLGIALKTHEGYEQHIMVCKAPVAEHIAAEYTSRFQSISGTKIPNRSVEGGYNTVS